ncbi:MAG: ABC transporter [Acidobacteria bacterium]|nr:MAG: ABC transporter [Acidobacteriota bacterium]
MTDDWAVEVDELVKEFPAPDGGVLKAVGGISFQVSKGECFGLLGPNGAGKTTTLEIIESLQTPSSGTTRVLGLDSQRDQKDVRERIGVQLQAGAYFDFLTLTEILDLFGSFYEKRLDPAELLEKVSLTDKAKARVAHLSGGQKQRFSIVAAMVNDPEVLFLDEPTTGLDPQARRNLWDFITEINKVDGKTVILTTHYMEEAELLCDRVAIIDQGEIVALDSPLALVKNLPAAYRITLVLTKAVDQADLEAIDGIVEVGESEEVDGGLHRYVLNAKESEKALKATLSWIDSSGSKAEDIRVGAATLEDVFLETTGKSLRD